jgi:hypothetical protein
MANTPIIKKRSGAFSVAVFEETKQSRDGGEYVSRSVVLQKSYKGQDGSWQRQTINLFDNNVADVALLLQATAMELMATPAEKPAQVENPAEEPSVDSEIPF